MSDACLTICVTLKYAQILLTARVQAEKQSEPGEASVRAYLPDIGRKQSYLVVLSVVIVKAY